MRSVISSLVRVRRAGSLVAVGAICAVLNEAGCLVSFNDYPVGSSSDAGAERTDSESADAEHDGQAGAAGCSPSPEVCDGIDNDCSGYADEGICPEGCRGINRGTHGYMFCAKPLSYDNALAKCLEHGMTLVIIGDADENAWLEARLTELDFSGSSFTAAGDWDAEGLWKWSNGTEFWSRENGGSALPGRYANWDVDEPNNYLGLEDCAVIRPSGKWNDVICIDTYSYICED